ncbi:MAG: hypothetical protein NTX51_20205, partial [Verrucomicrobia bacterium]|nr:hypothetical protein [Verrucomicrobiota bacterium]
CRYQAAAPVELRVLSGLQAGRLDELTREGAEAISPLVAALADRDSTLRPHAGQVLRSLANPKAVDALCAAWAKGRGPALGKLVAERRYHATAPVELRVLSGLQAGRLDELAREGAEAVPPLVAALAEKDKALAAGARRVLETFAAADALVDYALDQAAGAVLLPFINSRQIHHSVEGRWFLYLALAGRFEDYLAADFEFQTLRAEFRAAPPELQARIREAIVRTGDTRMNPLFVAEKKQALLAADLSDHDADLLVKLNARNQNWDALFKFLWVLPARHIRDAVAAMAKARWQPEDADRQALLHKLAGLVASGGETPKTVTAPVLANPVLQQWLARGEKEWAREPEAKLRERLKDEVPPPDQIAALGALRAQGQLTSQVLDQAARSQQWLVRLVATALPPSTPSTLDTRPSPPVNDGGKEWFTRLQTALDAESVWGLKPCQMARTVAGQWEVDHDALEALNEGLARMADRKAAGGLNLIQALLSAKVEHDWIGELGAHVVIHEDSFEIGG